MNCNEARQHWSLYHDSEGDAEVHFRISQHLATCPDCTHWFRQQSQLESRLKSLLTAPPPTPELWERVLRQGDLKRSPPRRPVRWLAGVAACALLALTGLWLSSRSATSPLPDLARLSAEWHQRLESSEETLQFRSQSDLEVEGYLRQRVTFPVRCPPRKDAGFAVEGAGVFRIADQPAAYLSGRVEAAPVSVFVLPRDSLETFPQQREAVRLANTHHCKEGAYQIVIAVIDRNAVLVIGRTDADRLVRVLRAYGTYPDHP